MGHIPSLDPRDKYPRPRPGLIRLFEFILGLGVFHAALRILDLFGEGQAVLDIYKLLPHVLQFLGAPWFAGCAVIAGFAGLIWQAQVPA